jgi:hypothetical protein
MPEVTLARRVASTARKLLPAALLVFVLAVPRSADPQSIGGGSPAPAAGVAVPYYRRSTADTNAAVVKSSAGYITGLTLSNVNAAARWVRLFDEAGAGAPTCTSTPAYNLLVPGGSSGHSPNLFNVPVLFANGIKHCITTGEDGTGAVLVGEVHINMARQ